MEELRALATNVDIGWTLVGAALVFFMQAGFAMVETGLTRAKNAGNIVMKNLMDFCIGTPIYWFIGFGIMFGGTGALIGGLDLFSMKSTDYTTMIFQTVFCATSATIVSGAMAERTKFSSYCIYSALISLFVYPISGHWIWGGGWLAQLGFHDFAGSTAVHMVGGVASEMIAEAVALMQMEITVNEVAESIIHAHPSYSEAFAEACADCLGMCIHQPPKKKK